MNNHPTTVAIPLPSGKSGYILAGATKDLPDTHKLVRCAREIPTPTHRIAFDFGTRDFQPFDKSAIRDNLAGLIKALEGGSRLYVGCMGGTGRTGTLLALMVGQHPSFSGRQAIHYVRQHYRSHAVETEEQEKQIQLFSDALPPVSFPDWYETTGEPEPKPVFRTTQKPHLLENPIELSLFPETPEPEATRGRPGFLQRVFG